MRWLVKELVTNAELTVEPLGMALNKMEFVNIVDRSQMVAILLTNCFSFVLILWNCVNLVTTSSEIQWTPYVEIIM